MALASAPVARLQPVAGAASTALRATLDARRSRQQAKVIAVFPSALYLELAEAVEPRVVAIVAADAVRLPNAIVIGAATRETPFAAVRELDEVWIGDGQVEVTGRLPGPQSACGPRLDAPQHFRVRVRRWWEPAPVLGTVSLRRLAQNLAALEPVLKAEGSFGLAGHPGPAKLAEHCAAGDLAQAVDAAERIVGLGPGLTPSGDDVLAGLLVTLRLVGGAAPGGGAAVWLADWLGAAVTEDAGKRTTALAATLLHCSARGQASNEVAALLRGLNGLEPALPALRRLMTAGHTSGSDLAWGVFAACRALLGLASETTSADPAEISLVRPPFSQQAALTGGSRSRRVTA